MACAAPSHRPNSEGFAGSAMQLPKNAGDRPRMRGRETNMALLKKSLLWAGVLGTALGFDYCVHAAEPTGNVDPAQAPMGGLPVKGFCAPKTAAHPPLGSCLKCVERWLFYRSEPTPCECKPHPTPYRPPLYAWFPCHQRPCATVSPLVAPGLYQRQPDNLLPQPPVPVAEKKEKSQVPGSSAALGVPVEPMREVRSARPRTMTEPVFVPASPSIDSLRR
jgi:hypothetical protein